MLVQFLAAVGVLAVLTVVPGPDMALVTKRAVGSSWQDGLRTVGGITAGLLGWGVLSVVGLAAVLAASAAAFTVVKVAGAAYLVFLGIQALVHSRHGHSAAPAPAESSPEGNPWRIGLVCNLLNPKIAVFYTGLLPTLAPSGLSRTSGCRCWCCCTQHSPWSGSADTCCCWPRPARSSNGPPSAGP
ncbi:LysE family translocator [Salinifilum aidingensis]